MDGFVNFLGCTRTFDRHQFSNSTVKHSTERLEVLLTVI